MTAKIASEVLQKRLVRALKLAGNTHTIEDIQHCIARGAMQCFVDGDSFVVTEVVHTPQTKFLNVFLAVGDMSVMNLQPQMVEYAKQTGCKWMQTYGRFGWKAVLPKHGWKATHMLFVHEIT